MLGFDSPTRLNYMLPSSIGLRTAGFHLAKRGFESPWERQQINARSSGTGVASTKRDDEGSTPSLGSNKSVGGLSFGNDTWL